MKRVGCQCEQSVVDKTRSCLVNKNRRDQTRGIVMRSASSGDESETSDRQSNIRRRIVETPLKYRRGRNDGHKQTIRNDVS